MVISKKTAITYLTVSIGQGCTGLHSLLFATKYPAPSTLLLTQSELIIN